MLEVRAASPVRYILKKRSKLPDHVRQDFGEVARRGHDETLVGAGPRDEVLDSLVLKHAVGALALAVWFWSHAWEGSLV